MEYLIILAETSEHVVFGIVNRQEREKLEFESWSMPYIYIHTYDDLQRAHLDAISSLILPSSFPPIIQIGKAAIP